MVVWFSTLYEWWVPLGLSASLVGLGFMLAVILRG